jgi:hypothetical protein
MPMGRYRPPWKNNWFVRELDAAASRMGADWDDAYVVYAILDPTLHDPERRYGRWMPIYVGQTLRLERRILSHFRNAEWRPRSPQTIKRKLAVIMQQHKVPEFVVLGEYGSRLEALKGETMWAQRLRHEGYVLANRVGDQRNRLPRDKLKSALNKKVRELSIAEAANVGVALVATCPGCQHRVEIDLRAFRNLVGPHHVHLRELTGRDYPCLHCGSKMKCRTTENVDPDDLVPDFNLDGWKGWDTRLGRTEDEPIPVELL